MTTAKTFGERLAETTDKYGHLCVGTDPHTYLLERWQLPVSAVGAHEFGLRVVEALQGRVGIVKPQVAFYERFGANGYRVLEDVFEAARAAGLRLRGSLAHSRYAARSRCDDHELVSGF